MNESKQPISDKMPNPFESPKSGDPQQGVNWNRVFRITLVGLGVVAILACYGNWKAYWHLTELAAEYERAAKNAPPGTVPRFVAPTMYTQQIGMAIVKIALGCILLIGGIQGHLGRRR